MEKPVLAAILSPECLYSSVMSSRLRLLRNGLNLLVIFCISTMTLILVYIVIWITDSPFPDIIEAPGKWAGNILITIVVLTLIFFAGMIRVYLSSEQLALKWRIAGLVCGFVPIINLIMLIKIVSVVSAELDFENNRLIIEQSRKSDRICATKYPILLVHGVFFRDFRPCGQRGA